MYTLCSGLYKYLTKKDEYFILILGLDNAGKTTYLEAVKAIFKKNYKPLSPNKIVATVGLNTERLHVLGVALNFWDLGGQEELQCLWEKYYEESHAIIFLIDSSDQNRIDECKRSFEKVISNNCSGDIPLIVLLNKCDIPGCYSVADMKSIFDGITHNRDYLLMTASALTGTGISESIKTVVELIKQQNA